MSTEEIKAILKDIEEGKSNAFLYEITSLEEELIRRELAAKK